MRTMVSFDLRNLLNHLIIAFVVIGTFFYIPAPASITDTAASLEWGYQTQELFFRYGVFFILFASMFSIPLRRVKFGWVALFLVYVIALGAFVGFDIAVRRQVLNVCLGGLFFKVCAENLRTRDIKKIGVWFFLVMLWNFTMCLQQYFGRDPLFTKPDALGHADMMVGFLRMKVHLGSMVSIMAPFVAFWCWPLALISVPLLFWSNSSGAVVAFVISMVSLLILWAIHRGIKAKIIAVLVLSGLIGLGAFYVTKYDMPGGQFKERFKIWEFTYSQTLKTNLFFGNGVSGFSKLGVTSIQKNGEPLTWTWAHNEYVQSFYEFGAVGIFIISFYVMGCFRAFFRNWFDAELSVIFFSLLSVFLIGTLHFPFHIARLAGLCLFVMGLFKARVSDLEDAY